MAAGVLGRRMSGITVPASLQIATRATSSRTELYKTNWKKDVVYLYTFPRPKIMPTLSPFTLKVETFLRVHRLNYETSTSLTRKSSRGLIPFIELNGEHIADSQFIIFRLQKHFDLSDGLSGAERGVERAVGRMVDFSTSYCLQQGRIVDNAQSFLSSSVTGLPLPAILTNFMAPRFASKVRNRVNASLGRLTKDELLETLRRDVQALDDILGEKKFLFGDLPSVADCVVFGQIGSCYFLPYRQPITDLLDDDFPRVKGLILRIRTHYFPDWKDKS